jgi:hypothetical protein
VTDTLLFLHLLSAAALFSGLMVMSAVALGAHMEPGGVRIAFALWNAGMLGVILLGIALAIDIDGYELWDAWIIVAIVLWLAAGGAGERLASAHREAGGNALPRNAVTAHWITVALVVLLLADMVWKPWT